MKKQRIYLFIAIFIPILMILAITFSLFIPVEKIMPPYNLLYATGNRFESYTCLQNTMAKLFPKKMNNDFYKVEPGHCNSVKLFVYDFKNDKSTPFTFAQAKKLHLRENLKTDSGYFYVSKDCYTGPDLGLWSMRSNFNDVCLAQGKYKRLLNIKYGSSKEDFYFISIGWIIPETSKREMKHE